MEGIRSYCAVRLTAKDGIVRAELTGDHYTVFAEPRAFGQKDAMIGNESPLYLVPDPVVRAAWKGRNSNAALNLSTCVEEKGNSPCGECSECMRARDEYFTHVIINAIKLHGEFAEDVREAVLSILGGVETFAPLGDDMDEEEFDSIIKEMEGEKQ